MVGTTNDPIWGSRKDLAIFRRLAAGGVEDFEYYFRAPFVVLSFPQMFVLLWLTDSNSAILAIMNITNASNDVLTRFAALISMICALMSLIYGCIYIIRFGTMRKTYKAAEWAQVYPIIDCKCDV